MSATKQAVGSAIMRQISDLTEKDAENLAALVHGYYSAAVLGNLQMSAPPDAGGQKEDGRG